MQPGNCIKKLFNIIGFSFRDGSLKSVKEIFRIEIKPEDSYIWLTGLKSEYFRFIAVQLNINCSLKGRNTH